MRESKRASSAKLAPSNHHLREVKLSYFSKLPPTPTLAKPHGKHQSLESGVSATVALPAYGLAERYDYKQVSQHNVLELPQITRDGSTRLPDTTLARRLPKRGIKRVRALQRQRGAEREHRIEFLHHATILPRFRRYWCCQYCNRAQRVIAASYGASGHVIRNFHTHSSSV